MSFATPLAFALAALAIPIIVFYILKVRLRRVQVSTNLFWRQLYDEKPPRSIWQYLRHLLSLLVQLLLAALLVLAVADPSFLWQKNRARRIVAVIDNSASMRAADVSPSRFEAAIESAMAVAEGLRFRDQMAIIVAQPQPEVVVGMSGHVPTLKRALQSIPVSDNPTELDSAIALGEQLIGDHHRHGQVLVFTDGCSQPLREGEKTPTNSDPPENAKPPADDSRPSPPSPVHYRVFGTLDAGNIGITQFQVRRSLVDPLGYEVLIAVKNASSQKIKGRLELELDESPVDVLPLDLEPDGVFTRSLEKTSLEGGILVAKLVEITANDEEEPEEANNNESADEAESSRELNTLSTDDQAWAVLPVRQIQNVLIVTPGNLFLHKVFEANPLVRVTVQKEAPTTWPTGGIIVLHRDIPAELPPGNVFIVDPQSGCDAFELGDLIENPIITEQDKNSPLMTHVRLDNVLMPEARRLKFTAAPRVLAGAVSKDPVYAEIKRTTGKCLVLSVNIDKGDLAFRTAFPIMATNALGWFAGQTGEMRQSLATGAGTQLDLPEEDIGKADNLKLRSPTGESQPLVLRSNTSAPAESTAAQPRHASIPPLSECGVWGVIRENSDQDPQPITSIAVNLSNASETDLRTPSDLLDDQPHSAIAGWFTRPIWFYLLVAAGLLTVTEWWLHQRRVLQ